MVNDMIERDFQNSLLTGKLSQALQISLQIPWKNVQTLLLNLGAYDSNIIGYVYTWFLLAQKETIERHRLGHLLMYVPFVYLEGSEELIAFHVRQYRMLNPPQFEGYEIFFYCKNAVERRVKNKERAALILDEIMKARASLSIVTPQALDNIIEEHCSKELGTYESANIDAKASLLEGDFSRAKALLSSTPYNQVESLLLDIAQEENNIIPYAYTCFLIMHEESVKLHLLAARFISKISYVDKPLPGAYVGGYYHTRRALELDPTNVDVKAALLFYRTTVDRLADQQEARLLAHEVLKVDPGNVMALCVLREEERLDGYV